MPTNENLLDKRYTAQVNPLQPSQPNQANAVKSAMIPNAKPVSNPTGSSNGTNQSAPLDQSYYQQGSGGIDSQASSFDDELAKLAREGNYKAYYGKLIQNANLNKLANRNLQNLLKQQGIDTQGAGTVAGSHLSNAYLNANAGAQSDFYDTENSITQEAYNRAQNQDSSNLSEWSQLLATASQNCNLDETYQQILDANPNLDQETRNKLSQYYSAYDNKTGESSSKVSTYQQYMSTAAQNGNLSDWYEQNVENNSELTDKEKAELAKYYSALNGTGTNFLSQVGINADYSRYSTADELEAIQFGNDKTGKDMSDEIEAMTNFVTNNKPNQETVFHLVSKRNGIEMYVYYDPASGGFYRLTNEQAGKFAGNKYYVDRSEITGGDHGQ